MAINNEQFACAWPNVGLASPLMLTNMLTDFDVGHVEVKQKDIFSWPPSGVGVGQLSSQSQGFDIN